MKIFEKIFFVKNTFFGVLSQKKVFLSEKIFFTRDHWSPPRRAGPPGQPQNAQKPAARPQKP